MKHVLIDIDLEPGALERLQAVPNTKIHLSPSPSRASLERAVPAEGLRGMHVLLCKRPPTNLADADCLEMIQICSVGFDHLAHFKFYDSPLRVCNSRGVFDTAIAEWNLAMMVNLVRDVPGMFRNQQAQIWSRDARFHQEIRSRIVGIWGYGGIGRDTARLARAFGMTVHVLSRGGVKPRLNDYTPTDTGDPHGTLPDKVFSYDRIMEFLSGIDFLILCLPRTGKTTGIVGARELAALKPSAWLLNVARGPIVQEAALIDALRIRRFAGAALDVHFLNPLPPEHPLWEMPNVILTPHISGSELSIFFLGRMFDLFEKNLRRFVEGKTLLNEITKEEWRETCGV
jgi:phosphoglycerate dehydrogenase-like enzyme